jgi:hypothetical protein
MATRCAEEMLTLKKTLCVTKVTSAPPLIASVEGGLGGANNCEYEREK